MSKILLSIKPEYVKRILDGTKKFEYRKIIASRMVDIIVIYSTSPQMKIVGEVEVKSVISMKPTELWKYTKANAGISKKKFMEYFRGKHIANAYQLGRVTKFDDYKSLEDYGVKNAPQSFVYLDYNCI